MLFSNVDDPNYTIESILNRIDDGPEFKGVSSWDDLKEQLKEFGTKGNGKVVHLAYYSSRGRDLDV